MPCLRCPFTGAHAQNMYVKEMALEPIPATSGRRRRCLLDALTVHCLGAHLCSAPVTLGLVDLDRDRHEDEVFFPFQVLVWTIEPRTRLSMDTVTKHCNLG